jgi:hypothetical protein
VDSRALTTWYGYIISPNFVLLAYSALFLVNSLYYEMNDPLPPISDKIPSE